MRVILQTCCQIQRISSSLCYVNCGPGHIKSTYSSAYLGLNILLQAASLLLEVSRQFSARYTAFLVPNAAHILQYTLCELWFRTYTKYLQLRILMFQYSAVGICAAIVHITTIQCALHCIFGVKYISSSLRCVNRGSIHIQSIYSSAFSCFNIQLNVCALQLEIFRHFDARYTANLVSNTAHIVQFTLCKLWSRTYTM
jgi:hypothetical protein